MAPFSCARLQRGAARTCASRARVHPELDAAPDDQSASPIHRSARCRGALRRWRGGRSRCCRSRGRVVFWTVLATRFTPGHPWSDAATSCCEPVIVMEPSEHPASSTPAPGTNAGDRAGELNAAGRRWSIPWGGRALLKYAPYSARTRCRWPSPRRRTGSKHSLRYRQLLGVDSRIATRELGDLVDRGLVLQKGTRRWATYELRPSAVTKKRAERKDRRAEILELLRGKGLSAEEIARALGVGGEATRRWLRMLRAERVVTTTTESPRSPRTRYRLVEARRGRTHK